jgi:hypothetical protein
MATKTQYYDPDKNIQTGYIIDDKTYTDAEGKNRVPVGSVVYAGGKLWEMTNNGGVEYNPAQQTANAPSNYADSMIRDMNAARTQSQINALNAAMNSSLSNIESARAQIPQAYRDARNETAGQSEVQRANFNQYASNTGLNSGAGGQAQLAFSSNLQGNLGALNRQEAQAMSDLARQEANLRSEYAAKIAQAQADGDYNTMSMLYSQWQNDQNVLRQQAANEEQKALAYAQLTGIFDGMAAYGWSPDMIAAAELKSNPVQPEKTSAPSASRQTQQTSQQTQQTQPTVSQFQTATGSTRFDGTGMLFSPSEYGQFATNVGMQRSNNGRVTIIRDALDEGKITEQQAMELLNKYGIPY